MANDAFRQLARAVFGRMKGVLTQVVRSETERAVRHFRERVASRETAPPALAAPPAGPAPAEAEAPARKPETSTVEPITQSPAAQSGTPAAALRTEAPPARTEAPPARTEAPPTRTKAHSARTAAPPLRAAAKRMAEEPAKKSKSDAAPADEAPVNVNAASRDELIALPGIGEARADAIVKGRPFKDVAELQDRKILPAGVFAILKDRIVAR